jgi:hypothetical protein
MALHVCIVHSLLDAHEAILSDESRKDTMTKVPGQMSGKLGNLVLSLQIAPLKWIRDPS